MVVIVALRAYVVEAITLKVGSLVTKFGLKPNLATLIEFLAEKHVILSISI